MAAPAGSERAGTVTTRRSVSTPVRRAAKPAEDDVATVETAPSPPRRRRRVSASVVARVAIGAAVAVLLVVSGGLGLRVAHDRAVDDARAGALSAAATFALVATNYDYRSVNREFQAVIDRSTGDFRDTFLFSSESSRAKIVDLHAMSTGTIYDAAVRDVTTESASVLVILDQKVVNTKLDAPLLQRDRLRLTLVRTGGRWLVSKLQSI